MAARAEFSLHARDMLEERRISEEWVWRAIETPDSTEHNPDDDTVHYLKAVEEREGRVLRVVVNKNVEPSRIVTVFFDRRVARRKGKGNENQD